MYSLNHGMASVQRTLSEYVEDLYLAENFEDAFEILRNEVSDLGFDGVLYTYIPIALVESNFTLQPFYQSSDNYHSSDTGLNFDASLANYDPSLTSANDDIVIPVDWWQTLCQACKKTEGFSSETTDIEGSYRIQNGIIFPLLSDSGGMAGASFIRSKNERFNQLTQREVASLKLRANLFHNLVISNTGFKSRFVRPWTDSFSNMQLNYLRGLAAGKKTGQIAAELGTTSGYLEQIMLKLRRKLSGVADDEAPTISRNQILYYAGLMNLLEFDSMEKCG